MDMINVLWLALAVILGILGGNGAVYVFNKMPAKWLSDYGESPGEDLLQRQRINSTPWKVLFSCLLVLAGAYLALKDPLYALAVMITFFLLILISIADAKYMIVPDQLCIALALCAAGFVPYHDKPADILFGGLAGAGIMFLTALAGRLVYKRETLGMGDVKLMAAAGLILGFRGIIFCMIGASLLAAAAFAVMLAGKRIKAGDVQPLGPYIACAYAVYVLVFWPGQW